MASSQPLLPPEHERIYSQRLKPDFFDGVAPSPTPTAVLVGGQTGSGALWATARIRTQLADSIGTSVVVSGDRLRAYHPAWSQSSRLDPSGVKALRADIRAWSIRVIDDALSQRANLILASSMRAHDSTGSLAIRLAQAGYNVSAVLMAAERDQSRQTLMAGYELAVSAGLPARVVPGPQHDYDHALLRDSLARLETERAIGRIQVIGNDGRQLYANERDGDHWVRSPNALAAFDDFRERRLTAREMADGALRWLTLVQRLGSNPIVPREVASLALTWSAEATTRAEGDAEARRWLDWGREAEAFKSLPRHEFLREFPAHAKSVKRLEEAIKYAETNFDGADDRQRFIAQSRQRLADRIAEGRAPQADRARADREPDTR